MATKTKAEKTEWSIPEEFRAAIKILADKTDEGKVFTKCAKNRMEIAEKAGDAETALREFRQGKVIQAEYKKNTEALWDHIHEAIPELDRDENYDFDPDDMTVSIDEDDEIPFARMLRG